MNMKIKLNLEKEISYLEKLFNNLFEQTEKFKKHNDKYFEDEFNECEKERYKIEKNILKTDKEFNDINLKLSLQIKEYNENISKIKNKFYEDKKLFENRKNYFKKENKKLNSEIIKIDKEFQFKYDKYIKERNELTKRISYLEKKVISNNIKNIIVIYMDYIYELSSILKDIEKTKKKKF